jgi:hypothetical protein
MQFNPNTAWQLWQVEQNQRSGLPTTRRQVRDLLRREDRKGPRGSVDPRRAPTDTNVIPSGPATA